VAGERAFYVPSLAVPDLKSDISADVATQSDSVRLFVERARTVVAQFELNAENVSSVIRICHRLDGIPLAIELATVRLKMMPVQQIADHIDDAFRLLTGGIRTAMPRHQTLQALMDWGYNLLTEPEKIVFRRLAVFAGGWTMEAAETIVTGGGIKTSEVLDILAHLVDKSLVLVDEHDHVARYHFLETIRQYAMTKLAESGEADVVRKRHAEYFLALVEKEAQPDPSWYDKLETEHDNLQAVLNWCQSVPEGAGMSFLLIRLLGLFSYFRGYWSEWIRWAEVVLAHPQAGSYPREQAWTQAVLGNFLSYSGRNYELGHSYVTRSLKVFQELDDRPNIAWALHHLGHIAREMGDALTARSQIEESVRIYRELGNDREILNLTIGLAEAVILQGEVGLAKSMLEENLALVRKSGDTEMVGWALNHLGHVAQIEGEYEKAIQLHEESLPWFQIMGLQNQGIIWAHQSLGETMLAQGEALLAAEHFTEALITCQNLGERTGLVWCLTGFAGVAALNEDPERAAWLWGAAEALRKSIGVREAPASHATHERLKAEIRQQLGEETFNVKWAEGEAASVDEAIDEAMLWR